MASKSIVSPIKSKNLKQLNFLKSKCEQLFQQKKIKTKWLKTKNKKLELKLTIVQPWDQTLYPNPEVGLPIPTFLTIC